MVRQNYSSCHLAALNAVVWAQKTSTSKGNNVIVTVTEIRIWRSAKLNPLIMLYLLNIPVIPRVNSHRLLLISDNVC